jgi:hypothetical protein
MEELIRRAPSLTDKGLEDGKTKLIDKVATYRKMSRRRNKIDRGNAATPPIVTPGRMLGAAAGIGVFLALRSHLKLFIGHDAVKDYDYEDCISPNVWCYAGLDEYGNAQGEGCCTKEECNGPRGFEEHL